jgi:hypothetical protein
MLRISLGSMTESIWFPELNLHENVFGATPGAYALVPRVRGLPPPPPRSRVPAQDTLSYSHVQTELIDLVIMSESQDTWMCNSVASELIDLMTLQSTPREEHARSAI